MYAIVDIETTGGFAAQNCITEIAIVLFNGVEIEGQYQTLINPERPIQKYVQSMTGITDAMVAVAPKFEEVAANIFNLLNNRVFVAHNVNFDYAFVKQHLKVAGFEIDLPKVCTIKMSRKLFPGLVKYGLGSICKHFNIDNTARHRAFGDAKATTELLKLLIQNDKEGEIVKLTKRRQQAQYLPPNITTNITEKLPSLPGVYYFHNKKGKVIYVGKAVNLKKRVTSHFSNNKSTKQKQDFLKDVYDITWKNCSSDLAASVFESIEIKRLWPIYNKSQKHYERQYGVFMFEDLQGYLRLGIDNKKKILQPIVSFQLLMEARQSLMALCKQHTIDPYMFFLSKEPLEPLANSQEHNIKVTSIVATLKENQITCLIHDGAKHYFLIDNGSFFGMGKIEKLAQKIKIEKLKKQLTQYHHNLTIQSYLNNYIINYPEKVIWL